MMKNKIGMIIGTLTIFTTILLTSGLVLARELPGGCADPPCFKPPPGELIDNSIETEDGIREVVIDIINYLLTFVGLIGVVAIIYFGFLWLTSAGNDEQVETGKKGIIWVGLGIILILLSYVIVDFFVGITSAGARGNNLTSYGELRVKQRIELLQENIENSGDLFSAAQAEGMYTDYLSLFDGLPSTNSVEVLTYHFQEGQLSGKYAQAGVGLKQLQDLQDQLEATSDPEEEKQLAKDLKNVRDSLKSVMRDLSRGMDDLPRMEAEIDTDPREGYVPATIAFSGLGSSDPMNTTIPSQNYHWSFVDHNGNEQDLGVGPTKVHTFTEPGSYVVRLEVVTASGSQILPGIETVTVRVFPEQTKADFLVNGQRAGEIVKISLQEAKQGLIFDPAPSKPTQGTQIVEYKWDFGGKKETHFDPKRISHAFSKEGRNSVALEVKDNAGNDAKKKVELNIEASVAIIKISKENPAAGERVVFDGTRSSLDGGGNMRFVWRIYDEYGSIINETNGNPQFIYVFEEAGKYEVELSIGNGISTKKAVTVHSRPPSASFISNSASKGDPAAIVFDASASRDPEGAAITYSWDFDGDGVFDIRNGDQPVALYRFTKKGNYRPRLVVTDESGQATSVTREIRIETVLNAEFTMDSVVTQPGRLVGFRAETKNAQNYHWDFGDGESFDSETASATHTYQKNGVFEVELLLTGVDGETNSYRRTIVVGDGTSPVAMMKVSVDGVPMEPKVGKCGLKKPAIVIDRNSILELSAADSVNSAGEQGGLEYIWDFHDGTYQQLPLAKKQYSELAADGGCEKISLTVREKDSGKTDTSENIYIYVKNILPTFRDLKIEPQKEPCTTPCPVSLRLENPQDQDGNLVRYRWWAYREGDSEKIELHTTTSPETVIILPSRGPKNKENTYYFSVDLFDDDGGQINSSQILAEPPSVTARNDENPEPVLDFFPDRVSVHVGEEVVFTSKLDDPTGDAPANNAYSWDFDGDGTFEDTFSGPTATHIFHEAGEYEVRLRVAVRGFTPTKTRTVFVDQRREPPFAEFNIEQQGLRVRFDASNSGWDLEIPENKLEYTWDFDTSRDSDQNGAPDDDADATGMTAEWIYGSEGEFTAALTVKNINGKTDTIQKSFLVQSSGGILISPKKTIRNAAVFTSSPMARLDLVIRYAPNNPDEPVEVYAFGSDLDGTLLNGPITFAIQGGEGDIISASDVFKNGHADAVILPTGPRENTVIEVTAATMIGPVTESISLPVL